MHKVPVALHPEVEVTINVTVARNADEAARLARGEDITVARTEEQEAQAEALANAESFFEPEAAEALRATRTRPKRRAEDDEVRRRAIPRTARAWERRRLSHAGLRRRIRRRLRLAELGPLALGRGRLRLGTLLRALRGPFGLLLRRRLRLLALSFSCGAALALAPCRRADRQRTLAR